MNFLIEIMQFSIVEAIVVAKAAAEIIPASSPLTPTTYLTV